MILWRWHRYHAIDFFVIKPYDEMTQFVLLFFRVDREMRAKRTTVNIPLGLFVCYLIQQKIKIIFGWLFFCPINITN